MTGGTARQTEGAGEVGLGEAEWISLLCGRSLGGKEGGRMNEVYCLLGGGLGLRQRIGPPQFCILSYSNRLMDASA